MIVQFKTQNGMVPGWATYNDPVKRYRRMPFRILYMAEKGEEADSLLKLLHYALVFPWDCTLRTTLEKDTNCYEVRYEHTNHLRPEIVSSTPVREILQNAEAPYVFILPISSTLPKSEYNAKRRVQRFFRRELWERSKYSPGNVPAPTLYTPYRTYTPVCTTCIRILEMQSGNCVFGDQECRKHMCILVKGENDACRKNCDHPENTHAVHGG